MGASAFGLAQAFYGVVAVIGPTRMNYERAIRAVRAAQCALGASAFGLAQAFYDLVDDELHERVAEGLHRAGVHGAAHVAGRVSGEHPVLEDYIEYALPVGSRTLTERHRLGVSPATVRNDLSALEDAGFIQQPHTSAGRVPTDAGYRTFVDELLSSGLAEEERPEPSVVDAILATARREC